MNMRVLINVSMFMTVQGAVCVPVKMGMGFILGGLSDAPYHIYQTEGNQQPSGQVAPVAFDNIQVGKAPSEGDTQKSKDDGTSHVTQAAQESDDHGFLHGPMTIPGENNKWNIMVRTQ